MKPATVLMDRRVVAMRGGEGLDWIFEEDALLVPVDDSAYEVACRLHEFGLWKRIGEDTDLEKG